MSERSIAPTKSPRFRFDASNKIKLTTYYQNIMGMNLFTHPSCKAQWRRVLPQTIVKTLRSRAEGASRGHSAYGMVVVVETPSWSSLGSDLIVSMFLLGSPAMIVYTRNYCVLITFVVCCVLYVVWEGPLWEAVMCY